MKKKYRPILKWILLSLLLLLFYLIERYGLSRIRLFSVSPQIVPVAVAVVALFEGGFGGAAFGLAAGLILDADSLRFDGYFSIVLLLGGTLIGILCTYMFRKNFLNALFMSLLLTAVTTLLFYVVFYLLGGRAGISALVTTAFPKIALSVLFTPIVYFPVRLVSTRLADTE